MKLVRQCQRVSSICSTWEPYAASFRPSVCHPRILTRIILVFDEKTNIHNLVLFPIPVPIGLPRTVFPTRALQVDVRTGFVQEETQDLQCLTMILASCVVEDENLKLDILTLEFQATLERPNFDLGESRYCIGCSCTMR